MRAYRVFPFLADALPGTPGHATYVPAGQASGRLDNPSNYSVRYFAESPAAAVAERFGELRSWEPVMFLHRSGGRLALAVFEIPDNVRRLDLDDAHALVERDLRPTQVVRRDKEVTQAWALAIHHERSSPRGRPKWDGVRWWSWYRPEWPVLGLWSGDAQLLHVERLHLDHAAVREAATALGRPLT